MAFPILGAGDSSAAGYNIENSCRFFSNTDLKRLPSSTGSSIKATMSVWVKFSTTNTDVAIAGGWDNSGAQDDDGYWVLYRQGSTGRLLFEGGDDTYLRTNAVFRDVSAWYHIVLAIDSAQNGDTSQRLYINGVELTSFAARSNLTNLQDLPMNTTAGNDDALLIGCDEDTAGKGLHFNGYMADFFWIDGTQYAASDFGEFDSDSGIWKPKNGEDVVEDLTMGTNGVFLEFKQTGTSANSSGIGADTGGNDLHFTVTNLAATDQCTDTPTNNFATLRIAQPPQHAQVVLSNGNCDFDFTGGGSISARRFDQHVVSNFAMTAGKWYCEAKEIESWRQVFFGISNLTSKAVTDDIESWIAIYGDTGDKYIQEYTGQSVSNSAHGDPIGSNATILIALDMDNKNVYFGQRLDNEEPGWSDGSDFNQSSPTSAISISSNFLTIDGDGSSVVFYFAGGGSSAAPRFQVNFGNPVQTITSGNADANGYGNFECTVPSGYYALCTKNIAQYGG